MILNNSKMLPHIKGIKNKGFNIFLSLVYPIKDSIRNTNEVSKLIIKYIYIFLQSKALK